MTMEHSGFVRDVTRGPRAMTQNVPFTEDDDMSTTLNPRPRTASFNALVAEMDIGESVSRVRAVDPTITVARLADELPAIRQQVRNAVAPAVSRAKAHTGGTYTVEVGDVLMPAGAFYIVAVVTRTA